VVRRTTSPASPSAHRRGDSRLPRVARSVLRLNLPCANGAIYSRKGDFQIAPAVWRLPLLALVEPALRIFGIVESERFFGQLQRVLGVEHDRELCRAGGILARLVRARMRAVWNAAGMQRNRGRFNPAARTEI